jgi:biotin carboxyl carrier protein
MYKAKTSNSEFEIVTEDDGFIVNGERVTWDKVELGSGHFHVLYGSRSYKAEVVSVDQVSKVVVVKINGNRHTIEIKSKLDLLLEKMGMTQVGSGKINSIKAPMPGLIIDLKVKEGDSVKQNDQLVILEAMKMENIIKSPGEGVVKSIKVKKGQSVEKNQILIEF